VPRLHLVRLPPPEIDDKWRLPGSSKTVEDSDQRIDDRPVHPAAAASVPVGRRRSSRWKLQPAEVEYVLVHGQASRDLSKFAPLFGTGFVLAAVDCVRKRRTAEGISPRTWWDNYAKVLSSLFEALARFAHEHSYEALDVVNGADLEQFRRWFEEELRALGHAIRTTAKLTFTYNKLLACLAQDEVLPRRVELRTSRDPDRATVGRAKGTVKALAPRSPRPEAPLGRMEFRAHGRDFKYGEFGALGLFAEVVRDQAELCIAGATGASKAKQLNISFKSLLNSLLAQKAAGEHRELFDHLAVEGTVATELQEAWQRAVHAWRDALPGAYLQVGGKLVTPHHHVARANELLHALADAGAAPPMTLQGYKNARNRSGRSRRLSIAELTLLAEKYDSIVACVWEGMQHRFDPDEQGDARGFIRALCEALTPEVVVGLPVPQLLEEMHKLNQTRLDDLRARAVTTFREWFAHWERGQAALIAPGVLSAERLVALLDSPLLSTSQVRANSSRYLYSEHPDVRLGNCLNYALAAAGGVTSALNGRFHHMQRSFGGRAKFQAYLHPHKEATLALWVIAMVDSGANCEVTREAPRKCLGNIEGSMRKVDFADKGRAQYKPISEMFNILPLSGEGLSLVQAIEAYLRMSERYNQAALGEARERLFVLEREREIRPLEEFTARDWFVRFAQANAAVVPASALPSMIRPAVLMRTQFRHGLQAAQSRGDHKSATTTFQHYTGRQPVTIQYELLMQEFVLRYEAVAVASIFGAADKLGVSPEEMQRTLNEAVATGLGILATRPLEANPVVAPHEGPFGDDVHWVVASESVIRDLIKFNEWLKNERANIRPGRAEEWSKQWMPWLVFTDVAIAKLATGETAAAFARANRLAEFKAAEE
jgi:hypothetical protein